MYQLIAKWSKIEARRDKGKKEKEFDQERSVYWTTPKYKAKMGESHKHSWAAVVESEER